MPNWCNNWVELQHDDPKQITRAFDALERGEFLQEFIPVPEDLKIVAGRVGADDNPEQIALEAAEKRNREKYGYTTWYEFCTNEWGTKWDCGEQGNNDVHPDGLLLTAGFDTAWAPPLPAYAKLEEQGFKVRAMYYEPGMAFAGVYEDGNDDYYNLEGMDSQQAAQALPQELSDMFGIVETMQEYEMENQEEEDLSEWLNDGIVAQVFEKVKELTPEQLDKLTEMIQEHKVKMVDSQ
jgi:hypothetical protein